MNYIKKILKGFLMVGSYFTAFGVGMGVAINRWIGHDNQIADDLEATKEIAEEVSDEMYPILSENDED